jgi:hypothetical protein
VGSARHWNAGGAGLTRRPCRRWCTRRRPGSSTARCGRRSWRWLRSCTGPTALMDGWSDRVSSTIRRARAFGAGSSPLGTCSFSLTQRRRHQTRDGSLTSARAARRRRSRQLAPARPLDDHGGDDEDREAGEDEGVEHCSSFRRVEPYRAWSSRRLAASPMTDDQRAGSSQNLSMDPLS